MSLATSFILITLLWFVILQNVPIHFYSKIGTALLATLATIMSIFGFAMLISSKSVEYLADGINLSTSTLAASFLLWKMWAVKRTGEAFRRFKDVGKIQIQSFLSIIIPASGALIYALWTTSTNGDQGWDSNAYHLSITGLLLHEGSNNFDNDLTNGLYTIFTPYGSHTLAAVLANFLGTNIYSSLITWIAVFGLTLVTYGYILDYREFADKSSLIFILPSVMWLIPSVFGQTSHFYVDALCGSFIAAMFILFSRILEMESQRKIIWLIAGLMGSASIATKSTGFYPLILVAAILLIFVQRNHLYQHLLLFMLPFAFLGLVPYFRNLVFFSNPIYPITFLDLPGKISTSEISSSFENFVPPYWSDNHLIRLAMSLLVGAIVVSWRVLLSLLGQYDPNRNDLSGFSYDTTYGGAGLLSSLVFFLVIFSGFWRLFQFAKRGYTIRKDLAKEPLINVLLLVVPIGSSLLMPGSWWPRYNLGSIFILLILAFKFLSVYSFARSVQMIINPVLILASLFQLTILIAYTTKYEFPMSHANVLQFNPNYGLTQDIDLKSKCERLVFVEPRPTFTSAYWTLGCREYEWTSTPEKFNFQVGDYAVFNPVKFVDFENSSNDLYVEQYVRAWFDPKGDYGSVFVYFKKVDG